MKHTIFAACVAALFSTSALAVDPAIMDLAHEVGDLRGKVEQIELQAAQMKVLADRHIEAAVAQYAAESGNADTREIQAVIKGVMISQSDIVAAAVTNALSPIEARLAALESKAQREEQTGAELTVLVPVPSADQAHDLYRRLPAMGYAQRLLVPRENSWSLHVGPFSDEAAAGKAATEISDAASLRVYVVDAQGNVK